MRIRERLGWGIAAALGLFVVAAMAGVATSGPLDPPGPVGSTMKTLEEIPGSWSRALSTEGADPCNTDRFRCVLNNEAVLDLETGLVWERVPSTEFPTWTHARSWCWTSVTTGDRRGWRLPTADEIATLLTAGGTLPQNHPFTLGRTMYWTGSEFSETQAYLVFLEPLSLGTDLKSESYPSWCVRGPGS